MIEAHDSCSRQRILALTLAGFVFLTTQRIEAGQRLTDESPAATKTSSQDTQFPNDPDEDPAEAYRELIRSYQLAQEQFVANGRLNKQRGEQQRNAPVPPLHEFAERFLDFARRNASSTWAIDALVWVTVNAPESQPQTAQTWKQAIEILERDHPGADALYPVVKRLEENFTRSFPAVRFLRAVADKNPNADIRGQACYSLSQILKLRLEIIRELHGPDSAKVERRLLDSFGKEFIQQLKQEDSEKIVAEIVKLLERVRDEFAEYGHPRGTLGEAATGDLFEIKHLAVGYVAPSIEGEDLDGKPFQLGEYRGKVVLLVFTAYQGREIQAFYQQLGALGDRFRHKPFALLGVNSDINPEPMREALKDEEIAWRMWRDGGTNGPIATRWNIHARPGIIGPRIFVLDHNGVIRFRDVFRSDLDEAIESLVAELERNPRARAAGTSGPTATAGAIERREKKIRPYLSRAYWVDGMSPRAVAFHPDGKSVVAAGWDNRYDNDPEAWKAGRARGDLRLLNMAGGSEIGRFDAEFGGLLDVALSADGKWIAAAGRTLGSPDGGEVRTWEVETRKPGQTMLGHKGWVLTVAISPDGKRLASGGFDRTVRIWEAVSGRELAVLPHPSSPAVLRYSGDGKILAAGCRGGSVRLWNTDTWQEQTRFDAENFMLHSVDLSADGALLAAGGLRSQNQAARSDDGMLRLWDVATGADKHTFFLKSAVTSLAFSHNRKYVVALAHTSSIINIETGAVVATIQRSGSTSEDKVAFTPDGKSVAIVDTRRVEIWDVRGVDLPQE